MEPSAPALATRQVSVSEAAREFGVSAETVRRWIKTGRLRAERAIRPQGVVWRVILPVTMPRGIAPAAPEPGASAQESRHATVREVSYPSAPAMPPTSDLATMAAVVRQQAETIARLVADLAEARAISDQGTERIIRVTEAMAELREDRGRLTAEVETVAAEAMTAKVQERRLADELTDLRATLTRYTEILFRRVDAPVSASPVVEEPPRSQRWLLIATLVLSIAIGALVIVLVLPR